MHNEDSDQTALMHMLILSLLYRICQKIPFLTLWPVISVQTICKVLLLHGFKLKHNRLLVWNQDSKTDKPSIIQGYAISKVLPICPMYWDRQGLIK